FMMALAMACGDSSTQSEGREAATEDETDIGAGEEISPQLELDSTKERFEVDSISSTREAEKESDPDDESF
ncbi:MAG: hypothetical protein M3Y60_03130, partial [Bacteroidota bacterium]|nr:hypothetical protein [Bacteroidota bacterium]